MDQLIMRMLMPEPRAERRKVRCERITIDGDILSYSGDEGQVGVYISAFPLSPESNYFEVQILDPGMMGAIAVGVGPYNYALDKQPGCNAESVAYHADDGKLYKANSRGHVFGPKCQVGDKIGCGVKFEHMKEEDVKFLAPVFFTRNGKEVGKVTIQMPVDGYFPCIGMHSEYEEVKLNLLAEWHHNDIIHMSIDNFEEEWSRLYGVRLHGQILEYIGRGKSIMDVGLAQARRPLDTTNHYFEIEIIDPGENCYIAIGLARKNYPTHRHPGWNKGSIAYHADDGKIFIGSGVGDVFGPRCHKGDIMGCGILFPRDYSSEMDSEGSADNSPDLSDDPVEDFLELEDIPSSDSEDDEWWQRPYVDNGTRVQVFFTRNGKTIGRKEIRIPKGGFFPTVGMLSNDEKVKVDLRPLTG